jgi:hypothetical protein
MIFQTIQYIVISATYIWQSQALATWAPYFYINLPTGPLNFNPSLYVYIFKDSYTSLAFFDAEMHLFAKGISTWVQRTLLLFLWAQ